MKIKSIFLFAALLATATLRAAGIEVKSPDGQLCLSVECPSTGGIPTYAVAYAGKPMLEASPLGLQTNIGDFTKGLTLKGHEVKELDETYRLDRIKTSAVQYSARQLVCNFVNADGRHMDITFRVSNQDVAFRYSLSKDDETGSVRVLREATGFALPEQTTTFLTPQSDAMIGWKRTKPSYEEEYQVDAPMSNRSQYGKGYTFPCLFRVGEAGWVLVSETGVDSRYCASRIENSGEICELRRTNPAKLSTLHTDVPARDNLYLVSFPMAEENNGNGTVEPAFALPGSTPWRTITVGATLKPIVETTVAWDVVKPRFESKHNYKMGRGTWSWILWQDNSINYDDQLRYVDLAAKMGYEYVLIDNWWDTNIGRERMEKLVKEAQSRGVDVFLWYSSSGYWNDIEQGPINKMDDPIERKAQMRWMQQLGVKGIKVDFWGGDKQETMRLYEALLSDADDHGLMVILHGCTLPRGWERMYPNFVGSEAVLASENLIFTQHACDKEAFNATLHPFIRNTVASMEWGGTFLNKRLNKGNDGGTVRRTTDVFELATAVLFQNPIQNFALAPNNLTDAPQWALEFMRRVPTTWDETRFVDGYPGRYVVLARRKADTWYVAAINATAEPLKLQLDLSSYFEGQTVVFRNEGRELTKVKPGKAVKLEVKPNDGTIFMTERF